MAGAHANGANFPATLYSCGTPLDAATKEDAAKWDTVGTCDMLAATASTGMLATKVRIPAGTKRGFYLHSPTSSVMFSASGAAAEGNDDVTMIPNDYSGGATPFTNIGSGPHLLAGGILYQVHV